MDVNWSELFDEILSSDEETPTTTTAMTMPPPTPQVPKERLQQRQAQQQHQASNSTKNHKYTTSSTSSLPTPSPELSHAQLANQPAQKYKKTKNKKTTAPSAPAPVLPPSPSPEVSHAEAWANQRLLLQRVRNNTSYKPVRLVAPSPPLAQARPHPQGAVVSQVYVNNNHKEVPRNASSGRPVPPALPARSWIPNKDDVLDELIDSFMPAPKYSATAIASLLPVISPTSIEHFIPDDLPDLDTPAFPAGNSLSLSLLPSILGRPTLPSFTGQGAAQLPSTTVGLGTSQMVFGCGGSVMDSFAPYGYYASVSSMGPTASRGADQLKANNVTPSLMNSKAGLATSASALHGRPRSLAATDTGKDTNFARDETNKQGTSTNTAFVIALPPQGSITSALAPVPAAASRRHIRFDRTPPRIMILDQNRVKGPPKVSGEETPYAALRRAQMEYVQDLALRQEHIIAKQEALNAQLHAAFPVGIQDENVPKNPTIGRLSSKKHLIDHSETDERAAKKTRATLSSSSSRISQGDKEDSTKEDSTVDHATFCRTVTMHTNTERIDNVRINNVRFNNNNVNISASNNTERNAKKHSLDLTDDHPTPSHQVKKPRPDDHSAIQYLGNNNITATNRQAQELSASSTSNHNSSSTSNHNSSSTSNHNNSSSSNNNNNNNSDNNNSNNNNTINNYQGDPHTTINQYHTTPKHPEFDDMLRDDKAGRTLRKARWEQHYPMVEVEDLEEEERPRETSVDSEM